MSEEFRALVLREVDGAVQAGVERLALSALPEGDVLVAISHSGLNYKDGMVVDGNKGRLVRSFPHVPGIDFAGTVLESSDGRYKPGDEVVLTGWRVGEAHWGGYAERARVQGDWLVPLPEGLDAHGAMVVGTAGFTAMLAVQALEDRGMTPGQGPVLVTGAAGGVGSFALSILDALGYEAVGSTGRAEQEGYLQSLGAKRVLGRESLSTAAEAPLEKAEWAGCIDSVGGSTLSRVLGQMRYGSTVACCGLAGGPNFEATVLPFLLRSVNIAGIDSVMQPFEPRQKLWGRLARLCRGFQMDEMASQCTLEDLPSKAKDILKGRIRGRMVVVPGA